MTKSLNLWVMKMTNVIEYSDVPYLQDILEYLPIDSIDDENITRYIMDITNLVMINYKYEQYQFAYFGVHLLYMTYIYCAIWKISKISPVRYCDVVAFARPYTGKEKHINIENISSIFEYCHIPEKNISKVFKIIGLNESQIKNVSVLVDVRNEMAHASGKLGILTEGNFDASANMVLASIRNIHRSMDKQIRLWFKGILKGFCNNEFSDYDDIKDIISEQMIQNFKLSVNVLLVCNEMSVAEIITEKREFKDKLNNFKKVLKLHCEELGLLYNQQ